MKLDRHKAELQKIRTEAVTKASGYILAAFGLVAGLAWNDAIKALIEQLFATPEETLTARFVYAGIITVFVIVITIIITRIAQKID